MKKSKKNRLNMSDKEFDKYIEEIMEGGTPDEEYEDDITTDDEEAKTEEIHHEEAKKPFKSFNSEEEYKAEINKVLSDKDAEHRNVIAQRDMLIENLKKFYETDDAEKAVKLFSKQVTEQKAAEKGVTSAEYAKEEDNLRKIKAYDAMEAERKRIEGIRKNLFAEADRIKQTDKEFDLQVVYNSDKKFKADLEETGSVYFAYANYVKRRSESIPKKRERSFQEEGSKTTREGGVAGSAANLPDKEFDEYIKNIMGEL